MGGVLGHQKQGLPDLSAGSSRGLPDGQTPPFMPQEGEHQAPSELSGSSAWETLSAPRGQERVIRMVCEHCNKIMENNFPFLKCKFCTKEPCFHHGRCCPENPKNKGKGLQQSRPEEECFVFPRSEPANGSEG